MWFLLCSFIISFVSCTGTQDPRNENLNNRGMVFAALAFCKGASIGPLIAQMLYVDPSLILMAILATGGIFLSFTLAAIFGTSYIILFFFLLAIVGSLLS